MPYYKKIRAGAVVEQHQPNKADNCLCCQHFFVTHEVSWPHGCRAYRFKSRRIPALQVLKDSGTACQFFAPKRRNDSTAPG
jgi:hypothetical protein